MLCEFLKAKWVDNESVEIILCASRLKGRFGLLTLNAGDQPTVDQYLNRVRIEDHTGLLRTFSLTGAAGDSDESQLRAAEVGIETALFPEGRFRDDDFNEVPLDQAVSRLLDAPGHVAICTLPQGFANPRLLKALRERFPHIVFLVRVGWKQPAYDKFQLLGSRALQPLLSAEKLNELIKLKSDLTAVLESHRTV